ncbi:MAG: menaquinone biosynthesis protein [Deltaproteobacteria bacterium]|nr:menaquinone biosynthesis protein [Deltaproteobacteria bacterium]
MPSDAPLRMGRLSFVNILPVHLHLDPDPDLYREITGVPSHLNRLIRGGGLDVSTVSSVEYAKNRDQYLILPRLSICSHGPVRSVLLFSRKPPEQWAGGVVEAPFESDTSVALVQLLLQERWHLACRLVPEGGAPRPDAVIRIGDRALAEAAGGHWPLVWDLGQEWRNWTGLPFVYALWVVRRQTAREMPQAVARLHQALLSSRDRGREDLAGCSRRAAQVLGGRPTDYLEYFQGLGYHLDAAERQGLSLFFARLHQAGILPEPVNLEFFGE